jgi:hypothetical protein
MEYSLTDTINLLNNLDRLVDGKLVSTDSRSRVSASCFAFALDTGKGINILLDHQSHSPAFALARIMYEAYILGTWFSHCASDEQIADFIKKDEVEVKVGKMILEIENVKEFFESDILSRSKKALWSTLCSFTHSGYAQLSRYSNPKELFANYHDKDITWLLGFISYIALLSCMGFSIVIKDEELSKQLSEIECVFSKGA